MSEETEREARYRPKTMTVTACQNADFSPFADHDCKLVKSNSQTKDLTFFPHKDSSIEKLTSFIGDDTAS